MIFDRNAYALACCVIFQFKFVAPENINEKSKEDIDGEEVQHDDHTFVALIDIVFTDGSKKTCTGTIIHDNVVITAAHCFCHQYSEGIKPELTASFVVIGTKKMFDSGYEQYLPIERILTHPKFRGWTADLSLVYTFAAMTSDKPGRVMPLAGEKMSNPVDSNVTVFSWGHCKEDDVVNNWHISMTTKAPCSDESSDNFNEENVRATAGLNSKRSRGQEQIPVSKNQAQQFKQSLRFQSRFQKETRQETDQFYRYPLLHKVWNQEREERAVESKKRPTTKRLSRYLSSNEDYVETVHQDDLKEIKISPHMSRATDVATADVHERGRLVTLPSSKPSIKRFYNNWRRHMGSLQNKLTVEIFGFVNMAACKKIVEGSNLPAHFEIKNGEVACYTSDEHYITEEDSGAPAIRHGQLVAVTIGGAQCDGDHVGVGMKMSCYCSWIADNLPGGGANINCCKNCCDSKNNEDSTKNMLKDRNKYLY